MDKNKAKIIKISKEALTEFIYEKLIEAQDNLFGEEATELSDHFYIDLENERLIFCAVSCEDENGGSVSLPENIRLERIIGKIPDTTASVFSPQKVYKEYSIEELLRLSE